jgi:hypothetical protein
MANKKTKAQIDNEVRAVGIALINTEDLTAVGNTMFIGQTEVDGETRFFEIKVTAKKDDFTQDDLDVLLAERAEVEARKKAAAEAAAKKRANDEKRRANAKAKAEAKKAAEGD